MAAKKYSYAVGRRKQTSAVIKLFGAGSGKFVVGKSNGKEVSLKDYFGGNKYMYDNALSPLALLGTDYLKNFDAVISIRGGGLAGQSDAIKLGFARALVVWNADTRPTLKPHGMLKRDARVKERKKPGLKKARKAPTRSKR